MFLERNPNIRKFATDFRFLVFLMMLAAHIKLYELAIDMHIMEGFLNAPIIHLLNKLYERGFYKRLQVYLVNILNQETVDRLATVSGLVKLCANVRSVAVVGTERS